MKSFLRAILMVMGVLFFVFTVLPALVGVFVPVLTFVGIAALVVILVVVVLKLIFHL